MTSLSLLLVTAVSLGVLHTLAGPDHYLPFIVLGRAEGWTLRRTLFWTFVCGVGHVLSSVVVGALGVGLGWALASMERFEGMRNALAGYALIGFGVIYCAWGLWRGWTTGHVHLHQHSDGTVHSHRHGHEVPVEQQHDLAPHEDEPHVRAHRRTMWALFIVFVLGPCEPLIPLLMVPAAQHSAWNVALVAIVFGVMTIGTMMGVVAFASLGLKVLHVPFLERYVHAIAGATLLVAGLATRLIGL